MSDCTNPHLPSPSVTYRLPAVWLCCCGWRFVSEVEFQAHQEAFGHRNLCSCVDEVPRTPDGEVTR